MRKKPLLIMVLLAPVVIAVFALFIYGVMLLWNWLMPDIFGVSTLTYWQTLGLLVLCKILFGFRFGGSGGSPQFQRRGLIERYEKMTPEEREKFRKGLRSGWCTTDSPEEPEAKMTTPNRRGDGRDEHGERI